MSHTGNPTRGEGADTYLDEIYWLDQSFWGLIPLFLSSLVFLVFREITSTVFSF